MSYARNTQNAGFDGTYSIGTAPSLPANSLNGFVVSKHADLRLSHQATSSLKLSAGYKYNERDNRTSTSAYQFRDLGTAYNQPAGADPDTVLNAPMSHKRTQFDLAGDYRIDGRQNLRLEYEREKIERWCNNAAANNAQGAAPSYYTIASCAQVPQNMEDKLAVNYRLRATDDVNFNAGYAYAKRKADVNSSFYNPMQTNSEGYENPGYLAFFNAARKEDQYKLGANWQANEKLNFGISGKYAKDDYDSPFGVKKGDMTSVNLDAGYSYSENSTVAAYATKQRRTRDMANETGRINAGGVTAGAVWFNNLTDDSLTLGIGGKQKSLMGGKLELAEDLTYSVAKTDYVTGAVSGTIANCPGATSSGCGSFPTIKSEMTSFKLTGGYNLDKVSKVVLGYMYQHLNADDATYYAVYQGTKSSLLPSYQQSGSYNQNVVFAAYNYSFK